MGLIKALQKVEELQQRYLPPEQLELWLNTLPKEQLEVVGHSVQNRPIHAIRWGKGPLRVLMWSQMHGNESTTTRALADLIAYLVSLNEEHPWQNHFQFLFVPQLNPDGAAKYTRVNANKVDLNRDAQKRSQPESQVLRGLFDSFQPHCCFNLHDQRSIFGAGHSGHPAQVSFLAPAADPEKTKTPARKKAAHLIVAMHSALRPYLDGCIGRYDDGFNGDCVGDTFQGLEVPTILVEAGHAGQDYQREECRTFIGIALKGALGAIEEGVLDQVANWPSDYDTIPENEKNFMDGLLIDGEKTLGYQYRERLIAGELQFIPERLAENQRTAFQHRILKRQNARDSQTYEELYSQLTNSSKE